MCGVISLHHRDVIFLQGYCKTGGNTEIEENGFQVCTFTSGISLSLSLSHRIMSNIMLCREIVRNSKSH